MAGQPDGVLVGDMAHHPLDQAHVIERLVHCLVVVNLVPVDMLRTGPDLLDPDRCQLGASSYIPYRLDVTFR